MRRALAILVALVALAMPSVAAADNGQQTTLLLTPSGQPVGGVWQRWMNDSYMPTYNGSMVLDLGSASMCGSTDDAATVACTAPSGFTPDLTASVASYPETLVSPRWRKLGALGAAV